ncbi:MAG: nucleotidyltransferase domain-containing protein [Thermocrispum sp.]
MANSRYSMCYMSGHADPLGELGAVAAEADRMRARASESLRRAVADAADRGFTQAQIAHAIGRSQPEVSRLLRGRKSRRFRPSSPLGRLLVAHRAEILALTEKHRAVNVRVFGSVARGDDDADSDIDLLVDLTDGADLLDLAGLDIELERLLAHAVDVVPARMLKVQVAPSALAEAVPL